jgi:hypothetical protein
MREDKTGTRLHRREDRDGVPETVVGEVLLASGSFLAVLRDATGKSLPAA